VFFSSHILSDVESMCDQVTILRRGRAVLEGNLRELLRDEVLRTEIVVRGAPEKIKMMAPLLDVMEGVKTYTLPIGLRIDIEGDAKVADALRLALDAGLQVSELTPRRVTLEDLFVERAVTSGDTAPQS